MSAFVKIPLQLLILSTGVLVFLFYLFQTPPMLFNRAYDAQVAAGPYAAEYSGAQRQFDVEVVARASRRPSEATTATRSWPPTRV